METTSIHILGLTLSAWVYGPVLFAGWLVVLYGLKGFCFYRLRRWGEKTAVRWDNILIKSLDLPLSLVILGVGVGLLFKFLPISEEISRQTDLAVRIVIIVALFFFLDRFLVGGLRQFAGRVRAVDLSGGIVQGLIRLTVLTFGFLILMDSLGISITPLVASLGIGSLAVALGLQETLVNLFAGLYIIADQPIRVGDYIELESQEKGYVTEIGSNNQIISSRIRNYYLPDKELAALVQVGVHYASDLEKVERITIEVAREIQKRVQGAVPSFEPFIRYHTFGESSVNFTVILRVREFTDQYLVIHEFIKALHGRYQKEGIVIPFPIRTLEISDKAAKTLSAQSPRAV
ncbi:MAG: mechanosensitive ion channel family protein [Candidatus Omnitrophica bacterium]|nr:mechanosensitive ion channel family protein [Candidatus Omnitrophota bacterium]